MKILKLIPTALIVLLLLTGCNSCNKSKSREKPDVSAIQLDVKLQRFDKDLFDFKTKDYTKQVAFMQRKYGPFYDFYIGHFVIGPHPVNDTTHVEHDALTKFLSDTYVNRIQDSINAHFKNTADVEHDLTMAFKYFKYYFPKSTTPKVMGGKRWFCAGRFYLR